MPRNRFRRSMGRNIFGTIGILLALGGIASAAVSEGREAPIKRLAKTAPDFNAAASKSMLIRKVGPKKPVTDGDAGIPADSPVDQVPNKITDGPDHLTSKRVDAIYSHNMPSELPT